MRSTGNCEAKIPPTAARHELAQGCRDSARVLVHIEERRGDPCLDGGTAALPENTHSLIQAASPSLTCTSSGKREHQSLPDPTLMAGWLPRGDVCDDPVQKLFSMYDFSGTLSRSRHELKQASEEGNGLVQRCGVGTFRAQVDRTRNFIISPVASLRQIGRLWRPRR